MAQTLPNSSAVEPNDSDPLAHLYKMSRTAGLGSGDYVAINPVAVTALVFGIAGALVVVDSLFIVLPLVGLILGIIGWRQVRRSNGTQTGGVMAGLAILLSVVFLGAKVGKETLESFQLSADKQQVNGTINGLGEDLAAFDPANPVKLQSAYDRFDEAFKSRISFPRFQAFWLGARASPFFGPMTSLQSNGLLKFETDPRSGDLVCTGIAIAGFQRGESPRWTMVFRQLNGKWYVEDMPDLFPPPAAPGQGQRR